MDPNPKSTKTLDDDNPTGIDIISNLPDEILCQILSFLPTKYAVGTSILSTRWKNLFPFIPNLSLHFDDSLLLHPHKESPNLIPNFVIFVYNVLKNAPHIYSFSLRCQRDYEVVDREKGHKYSDITLWVYCALCMNVRELTVEVDKKDGDFILFARRIFYCPSVMWVTIRGRFLFDSPSFFYMPNLSSIFLDRVKFRNGEVVRSLIRGCLSLKEFCLEICEFEELEVLEISSPELKRLIIINCKCDGEYEVVLDVPNLEVLHYQEDAIAYDYIVKNLGCLREAHIDIDFNWELVEDNAPHYENTASRFVAACSNLETLYLSQNSLHAIQLSWEFIRPTFCNLTTLKLGIIDYWGWPFLPSLLRSCPNLEVLEFTCGFTDYEEFPHFVSCLAEHEPQCLSSHLQKVKIQDIIWDEDELNVVEFFLKSAKVLREVEINSVFSSEEQLNIVKKISLFPKCSAACEIVFTSTEV